MTKRKGEQSLKPELRSYTAQAPLSIRTAADGARIIAGTAVVYNSLSQPLGGFVERIATGAFSKSLRSGGCDLILYNHDTGQVLGRQSAGTATVTDSPTGLNFTCKLGDTTFANDLANMLTRGDVRQCSFGFAVVRDEWSEVGNEIVRTVLEAEIFEISVVSMPAYTQSSVGLRSALATCPPELRKRVKDIDAFIESVQDDSDGPEDDNGSDDGESEDRSCSCRCESCSIDADCSGCDDIECLDDCCLSDGCPQQDDTREDRLRIRQLFAHRTKFPSLK